MFSELDSISVYLKPFRLLLLGVRLPRTVVHMMMALCNEASQFEHY